MINKEKEALKTFTLNKNNYIQTFLGDPNSFIIIKRIILISHLNELDWLQKIQKNNLDLRYKYIGNGENQGKGEFLEYYRPINLLWMASEPKITKPNFEVNINIPEINKMNDQKVFLYSFYNLQIELISNENSNENFELEIHYLNSDGISAIN